MVMSAWVFWGFGVKGLEMSVFPISLPLYPIMNASDSVQNLLAKDAEEAKSWPSESTNDSDRAKGDTALTDAGRPAHQIRAVEASAEVVAAPASRSGADKVAGSERASSEKEETSDYADPRLVPHRYQEQANAVRLETDEQEPADQPDAIKARSDERPEHLRLDKRT